MKIVSVLIITRLTLSKAADDPCEPCRGAAFCFQDGCTAFDIDKQTWSGLFSPCNGDGNTGAALCYDACYTGACKSLPMCTACSDNDLKAVGVSEECFTAVKEYEESLSEEPKYANDCDYYAVASNVTVECQEAVAEYHDCGGNYNYGPVCTACEGEDPDVDGVSENCYNALVSFRPSGKPVYEQTCGDLNDASDVTVECIRALGEYFGPLCDSDKSGSGSSDSGDHDSVCDACEYEDPDVVGVSEECFTAVGEYEDGLDEEPPYRPQCEDIEDASDVSVECKAAVSEYFGCESSSACPQGESKFLVEIQADKKSRRHNLFIVQKQVIVGKKKKWKKVQKRNKILNNEFQEFDMCLASSTCYRFRMKDKMKDGLCCKNGEGYYKTYYEDTELEHVPFDEDFGKKYQNTKFGDC